MRKKLIIGIIVSLFFVYLAIRKVDWGELKFAFQTANYLWIFPNMILVVLSMYLRAYRWKFMVSPIQRVRMKHLFSATMIGFMANNVLPARLGELIRAYSLGAKENMSRSASFATIVVERVFDGFSLLFVLWVSLIFSPFPDWVKRAGNITLAANVGLVLILILLEVKTQPTMRLFEFAFKFLPSKVSAKASSILQKFISGLKVLRDVKGMLLIMFWSLVIWFVVGASNYFIFLAFDLHPPLQASFILLVMVSLAIMIPSSPGYVGVFHYASILSLGMFGYDKNLALPFSVVLHISQYIPITLIGLIFLKTEHLSLKTMEKESLEISDPDQTEGEVASKPNSEDT